MRNGIFVSMMSEMYVHVLLWVSESLLWLILLMFLDMSLFARGVWWSRSDVPLRSGGGNECRVVGMAMRIFVFAIA